MVDANTVTFWLSEVLQPAKIADQARKGIETEVFLLYQKGRDPRIFQAGPVSGNACIETKPAFASRHFELLRLCRNDFR